jgi:adenine-specific DNA-methyltransferase
MSNRVAGLATCRANMAAFANAGLQMLDRADSLRTEVAALTPRAHKSALGQFMTPTATASFMAGLFEPLSGDIRLLDPGAGLGALSCATLDRWLQSSAGTAQVVAYEFDDRLGGHLRETLAGYAKSGRVAAEVRGGDFIEQGITSSANGREHFTHAILNPPYKKISSNSHYRAALRLAGLETVNLYAGFVAVALSLLQPGGQLVAIIPRSFCNGPYYRPFRDFILERSAIRRLHLFESRSKAFKDDDVLQENVIMLLEKGAAQGDVVVSTSHDDRFSDLRQWAVPFQSVVFPDDAERFIHIATEPGGSPLLASGTIRATLKDLGLSISTGPVVDFRLREHLLMEPSPSSVPLLYASHCVGGAVVWPKPLGKKANAIADNEATRKWLMPRTGWYVLTRRFTSKEERRRVVASLLDAAALDTSSAWVGFENHLNVFHEDKRGMPEAVARGLALYLNSTAVDDHFRRFNGHTQVNATDLRSLRYPSRAALTALGEWGAAQTAPLTQADIDTRMEHVLR